MIGFERLDDPDGKGPAGAIRQPKSSQYAAVREAAAAGLDAFGFNSDYAQQSLLSFIGDNGLDLALYNLTAPAKIRMAVANGQKYAGTDNPAAIKNVLSGFNPDEVASTTDSIPIKQGTFTHSVLASPCDKGDPDRTPPVGRCDPGGPWTPDHHRLRSSMPQM